ncbi:hypothetical protein HOC37_07560 [bacterium]|jgi:hypothetical protein|nr:hypothetical protein [bacterium]
MKIILFRFEKEKINFLECEINSRELILGEKGNVSLEGMKSSGERYKKILDELLSLSNKYKADVFAYQPAAPNMRGKIDEVRFANEAMLNLFCNQNDIELLALAATTVRKKLAISSADFKVLLEKEKANLCEKHPITKSDKLLDGLCCLVLIDRA